MNQYAFASSSIHNEILPPHDELYDLKVLSPSDNEWVSRVEQIQKISEFGNQSGDTILLEWDTSIEKVPLTPEENIIPPSQDIYAEITSWTPKENIIYDKIRTVTTVTSPEATATPSPAKILPKEKITETNLRKMNNKCRKWRKMVKKLRKWLEEAKKAWKPKKELATMGDQTNFVTQMVDTAELSALIDLILIEDKETQTEVTSPYTPLIEKIVNQKLHNELTQVQHEFSQYKKEVLPLQENQALLKRVKELFGT